MRNYLFLETNLALDTLVDQANKMKTTMPDIDECTVVLLGELYKYDDKKTRTILINEHKLDMYLNERFRMIKTKALKAYQKTVSVHTNCSEVREDEMGNYVSVLTLGIGSENV